MKTEAADRPTEQPTSKRALAGALVLFLGCALLYGLTRRQGTFSDAVMLAERVANGPTPYYNALYLPLGWAFHRTLEPLFGWDSFEALSWLSVLAGAASVALVWVLLLDVVREPLTRLAWCLLFALTPGVWFFSASVEVHALQLTCVTAAVLLAWRARSAPRSRAPALVALAMVVAMLGHLTSVLLLPALLLLGWSGEAQRGLSLRRLPWKGLLGAGLVLALAYLGVTQLFERFGQGRMGPAETLDLFHEFLMRKMESEGLFSPAEVAGFLVREFVRPAGLLVAAAVLGLFQKRDGRMVCALIVALVPYLLLLPQGGIRESGAYYLSLLPFLILAAARAIESRAAGHATALLLGVLLLPQAWLGWRAVTRDGGGEDARVWAEAVSVLLPEGGDVYTATLPRWHALTYVPPPFAAVDMWRMFEMLPRPQWEGSIEFYAQEVEAKLAAGRRFFVDVDLFRGGDRPHGLERLARAFEKRFPHRRYLPEDDPLLVELLSE